MQHAVHSTLSHETKHDWHALQVLHYQPSKQHWAKIEGSSSGAQRGWGVSEFTVGRNQMRTQKAMGRLAWAWTKRKQNATALKRRVKTLRCKEGTRNICNENKMFLG